MRKTEDIIEFFINLNDEHALYSGIMFFEIFCITYSFHLWDDSVNK